MAYPAKLWAKIKTDYETGNYSVRALAEKYGNEGAKVDAIELKAAKWDKGKLKPLIEKSIQQKFIDAFAKRKFDESRVAEIVDEMGSAEKPVIVPSNDVHETVNEKGEKINVKQTGFADTIPDWIARDKAITQWPAKRIVF